jgi:hypothetical protein
MVLGVWYPELNPEKVHLVLAKLDRERYDSTNPGEVENFPRILSIILTDQMSRFWESLLAPGRQFPILVRPGEG